MDEKEPSNTIVLKVGYDKSNIFIYVIGEATMIVAPTLKKFAFDIIDQFNENAPSNIYLNLSECKYMDSTFIGTLILLEKQCVNNLNKHILLTSPSGYCHEVLEQMGLLKVFTIIDFPETEDIKLASLEMQDMDRLESAILMYQAHEELSGINENNKKQFSVVTKMLKKEIEKEIGKKEKKKP
jgi:anti-anti-sigma factor